MKFNYQARNKTGEIQTGVVEASSREAAISVLQRYGLYVTFLERGEEVPFYAKQIRLFEKVSPKDLVMFSRQLSIMFGAKVPLVEALRTLGNQMGKAGFKEKILKIADDVEAGASLSLALSKFPEIFSSFYIAMVKSGEAAGKLSESLHYLAEHLEREYNLSSRMKGAMIYPALVLFMVFAVLALMIFFVIPQIGAVLEETGQEWPTITKVVMTVSSFLKDWGLIILAVIIIIIGVCLWFSKTPSGKKFFDRFSLGLPGLGNFLKLSYLARIAETLSTLIAGGLPISQCLEISAQVAGNSVYQEIIFQAKEEISRGEQISRILARFPEFFPPVFTQMILVGETTGTLDKTLVNVVNFYREEVFRASENFLSILEPVLIIFLGVVVGGVTAAFLLPIYQIASGF